jgi:CubicO group peptidase (beta-lactamase class C family)
MTEHPVLLLLAALLVGATVLPIQGLAQAQDDSQRLTEHPRVKQALTLLDRWASAELTYNEIPGASLAVVHDQERLWAKGWGMKQPTENEEATPKTLYSVCSISKLFTSVAAMTLWEEGKIELNDRVEEHLSWFALEERQSGLPLTLESLLTHSSGLPRESDYPYWSPPNFDFPDRQEIRTRIRDQRSLYPSQRYFQYSNLGLTLIGEVVAATSDTTYSAYVQEEVLGPLNLESTSPSLPWTSEWMATGYSAITRSGDRDPVPSFQAEGLAPAAGYASSVLDLTELAAWQFRLLEGGDEEVLKPPTLEKMHNVHWVDPDWDVHWGLGFSVWQVDEKTYVGHGGSCPGFRSHLALRPDKKLGAAFAANANGTNSQKFTETAIQILAPAVSAANDTTEAPSSPPPAFEKYVGNYSTQPWGGEIAVIPWKGGLAFVELPTEAPLEELEELKHVEGNTFRRVRENDELGEPVRFRTDESGRVDALIHHSNAWPRIRDGR